MEQIQRDPKSRFSNRLDDYVKYRPHYSAEVVQALEQACALQPEHLIADVGCGTGLLAEVFLGMMFGDNDSLLNLDPNWQPASGPNYQLKDFVKYALGS